MTTEPRMIDEDLEKKLHQALDLLREVLGQIDLLRGILPICSFCKRIQDADGRWILVEDYLKSKSKADLSHGICPDCAKRFYPELLESDPFAGHAQDDRGPDIS